MADYIYTMESRLTPDQQKGASLIQQVARNAAMNLYLTGGTIRDVISGFPIRDLDFTLQGNPFKLQKDLEKAGAVVAGSDDETKTLYLELPGRVRVELAMARTERYEKTGKPPVIAPATIIEDLRRRDFTINAMALSLNEGSRGLLMDPFNGVADLEAKVIRILHNYAFLEEPSRLIRATRFAARFHWPLEERTQARYDAAKENNYIEYILPRQIGHEIEQLAYEDDPLHVIRALEKEGWLKILGEHWTTAKVDANGLSALMKTRQQMNELGYQPDTAAAAIYFLTSKLSDKEIADMRKAIPRKTLVEAWKDLEDNAKDLAKKLSGKESATPSRTWQLLSNARPEMILFLAVTSRQQGVQLKIKNFFTKWRQVQQKVPLPEMTELHITPQLPEYAKIAHDVFLLLLDGKLRSRTETLKYLKPLAPPPPPPPPPPPAKRGRGAKAAVVAAAAAVQAAPAPLAGKKKGKAAVGEAGGVPAADAKGKSAPGKAETAAKPVSGKVSVAKPVAPAKPAPPKHAPSKPPAKPSKAPSGKGYKGAKPAAKKAAAKKKH